jgi:hypothetical protein
MWQKTKEDFMETEIQKNLSITDLAKLRAKILNDVEQIMDKINEVRETWQAFDKYGGVDLQHWGDRQVQYKQKEDKANFLEHLTKRLDSNCWSYFFGSSGIQDIMSSKDQDNFKKKIAASPENFTVEAALVYTANSTGIITSTITELLSQVYNHITESKYRTNKQLKKRCNNGLSKEIRLSEWIKKGWGGKWDFGHYSSSTPIYTDLEKLCLLIDGKNPLKYPQDINSRIKNHTENFIENDYFTLTIYLNGNQKLVFKRLDIMQKINLWASDKNKIGEDIKIKTA